ncbi:hypothetical protein GTO91_15785 [Heliobacterium undosum]|uniref:Prepilin type IV endopeptidase peptidase domain-containing protein n=1 Tax=Heliomicrobium undosum TaxID=121734 RepID=A0A845LBW8_9FIRM|nr:A24 family peptidase [Heliomicrobium undosum]MZP31168.1 hypothetical protein [Heliomicrobium undosum]
MMAEIPCAILLISLAVAAWHDARTQRIPNWLTFGMTGVGLSLALLAGNPFRLEEVLLVLVFTLLPFLIDRPALLPGGDGKMLLGMTALVGLYNALAVFLIGSILSLVDARIKRWWQRDNSDESSSLVPLAPGVFVGAVGWCNFVYFSALFDW